MGDLRPQVWTSHSKCNGNNISYLQALRCLADIAVKQKALIRHQLMIRGVESLIKTSQPQTSKEVVGFDGVYEGVSVLTAIGRVCAHDILSPCSTPVNDTSAMDGFAVASALTVDASPESPVGFFVAGTVAAGTDFQNDQYFWRNFKSSMASDNPCVEIMTGAYFPEQKFPQLDAVVKVEDVELVEDWTSDGKLTVRCILISSPVKLRQHRRPAGSDFCAGDLIVAKGTEIEPKHVMALASVGIKDVPILPNPITNPIIDDIEAQCALNVGVLSTGSELLNIFEATNIDRTGIEHKQKLPDSNGPYIASAVRSMSSSFTVEYIGPCPDDEHSLDEAIGEAVKHRQYDVVVTSGGVSMGRFDLVRKVIESRLGAEIYFHGCLVRPGAPVLFGVIYHHGDGVKHRPVGMTTLIGAPGNPLAAAMTVRFFLNPFLRMMGASQSMSAHDLIQMTLSDSMTVQASISNQARERKKPVKAVAFLLAKFRKARDTNEKVGLSVDLLEDQASYKIKPFLRADCWIAVPAGNDRILSGDESQSYSLW